MRHALEDITVVEFGQFLAAPVAARLWADLGARVTKVEPLDGEPMRPSQYSMDSFAKTFQQSNAGKRGVALNLKDPAGQTIAHRLMAGADVVVHNFRPGVAERLKVDYATARQLNPRIIYGSFPGYGSQGPRRDKPGFEPLYSAFCGVHRSSGGSGNPPTRPTSFDQYCGLLGANAILMALYYRDQTGQGQHIEVAQLAQVLYYTSEVFLRADGTMPWNPVLDSQQTGYGPLNRLYQTQDGWVCICCWKPEEWHTLCRALEREDLFTDLRFQTPEGCLRNGEALAGVLGQAFRGRPTAEWAMRLEACHVPFEVPIMDGEGMALTNPEYVESGLVAEYAHPAFGRMRAPGFGLGLSLTPGVNQGPAPLLGQHTREVLAELGYTSAQMEKLRQQDVVAWTEVGLGAEARVSSD